MLMTNLWSQRADKQTIVGLVPNTPKVKVLRVAPGGSRQPIRAELWERAFLVGRLCQNGAYLAFWPTGKAGRHLCSPAADGSLVVVADELPVEGAIDDLASHAAHLPRPHEN